MTSAPAHHVRLPEGHAATAFLPSVNVWLDDLRERGEFGRLLAARGNLEAFLRSLGVRGSEPADPNDMDAEPVVDFLAGHGPVALYRGSWYFATDAGRLLSLWARDAAQRFSMPALNAVVGEARARVDADVIRTMEAFEHLAWTHFGSPRRPLPSLAAGWFRVQEAENEHIRVSGVDGQVSPPLDQWTAVRVPRGAGRRLRQGDLLWMDIGTEPGGRPLAIGTVCCGAAERYLTARQWPGARSTRLPPDVRARFTGRTGEAVTPDGELEQ